jgi:hypothetical protein
LIGSKLLIIATAAVMGALGGFTHDIIQNKRFWQNAVSTPAGYFLGTAAGIFLGVVSGLLVALLLPPSTALSTAAYAGLLAGISLKGLTEAASSAAPAPTLTLTSDISEVKNGNEVTMDVVVKKSDGTAASGIVVNLGQSGDGSLDAKTLSNPQTTGPDGTASPKVKATKPGGVVVTATAMVENQPVSSYLELTIT